MMTVPRFWGKGHKFWAGEKRVRKHLPYIKYYKNDLKLKKENRQRTPQLSCLPNLHSLEVIIVSSFGYNSMSFSAM